MSGMAEFTIGEGDDGIANKNKRFKCKEGEKYRISFAYWPGMAEGTPTLSEESQAPKFIACKRLFLQGVGYFVDKGPEFVKIAGGAASKMQIATVIIKWPLDRDGQVDVGAIKDKKFQVLPWIFSADKYKVIEQNHREFPLNKHDLNLACTDTQYQKLTISPCRESLFKKLYDAREKDPSITNALIAATQEAIRDLPGELAQDLTMDQIREKLSRANGGGGGNVGGGGGGGGGGYGNSAHSSKELDSILDDIIG